MHILDEIVQHKQQEVKERKSLFPKELLEKSIFFNTPCVSMKKYVTRDDRWGIIAEFKRRSPSKGLINDHSSVEQVSIGYMQAGASGLSVLTDSHFFGGKNDDLTTARKYNFCPILRKEFIIDQYQIIEAKSIGADAILLIASILTPEQTKKFAQFAHDLGLEVLLEVHDKPELEEHLNPDIDLVGVNNRDLKSFEVDINTSIQLANEIPDTFVKVSESGINDPSTIIKLKQCGFSGFLIGQNFMMQNRPEKKCQEFIDKLKGFSE